MAAKDAVGRYGERVVAERLTALGWEVLERNWRCALGELDIVAVDRDCIVAVEVKTRRTATFGSALEAVTPAKVARIRKLLAAWLASQPRTFGEVRIDVVGVTLPAAGAAHVEHVRGAA
ncbi:YraN family protein [Demequina sp.]|uniref:YraN family protein n=1 Tax=Demequina sp. TaxID=2050685 RepID=UPI0025BF5912|nr:YraN family protein [Demequina sp.]